MIRNEQAMGSSGLRKNLARAAALIVLVRLLLLKI